VRLLSTKLLNVMASTRAIAAIGRCLSNRLDPASLEGNVFAAVIGDAPSSYSKSPQLWNAAFRHLRMSAVYLPFDVRAARLGDLLEALRDTESFLGANVTVPYKVRVMDFLDEVGRDAERIQAVNTIVRSPRGKLIGHNTDGEGFVRSILRRQPDRPESFLPSFEGLTVVLLGAGGSARAVAFHLADLLAGGRLFICNRTSEPGRLLAAEIRQAGCDAIAIAEADLAGSALGADLIVNATVKGQGGVRKLADGRATLMAAYSALARANPPLLAEAGADAAEFERRWWKAADDDVERNQQASLMLAQAIPPSVRFYDLVYHPEETVFLRHGRSTGHPTMNGKSMIINQAVIAFCERICAGAPQAAGAGTPEAYDEILAIMYRAW
jgi:shikimate dehydrogenase